MFALNSVFTPKCWKILSRLWMSAISGTFFIIDDCWLSKAAQRIGNAAFLDPLTVTSPFSVFLPLTMNFCLLLGIF